jgi:2,4-dienoyl-CoA reductase-like NADH-dependent reductase (Old Yellow Enzyme family)
MRGVFDGTEINGMKLANRLVRSATWEGMCEDDGRPTGRLVEFYRTLAKGGVGLIITGYTFVRPDGKQLPGKMGLHTDDFIGDMKKISAAVHEEGGKICMQLVHSGGQTSAEVIGRTPLAPSAVAAEQYQGVTPDEMSFRDIKEVAAAFEQAAKRAKDSGFDAVQLHGAHGYLINQFLSPLTNRRTDEYGGSDENRCRFMMDVYRQVRSAVGDAYPVMIKLNGSDNLAGGLEPGSAVHAARLLDKAGIDAIEVSGGTAASGDKGPVRGKINRPEVEAYNLPTAREIKKAVSCPVMVVGGFRSYEVVEDAIINEVDYVSISRPLIREPGLPARWQSGDRAKARCISCSRCFLGGLKEGGIYCVTERRQARGEVK